MSWINAQFSKRGYTCKKPNSSFHSNKFLYSNIIDYLNFIISIKYLPKERLKFVDESHIDGRHCKRRSVRGPSGARVDLTQHVNISESLSISLLTSLSSEIPVLLKAVTTSNDQFHFLEFIIEAIERNYLVRGDYLIMDNAKPHGGKYTTKIIHLLSRLVGFEIVRLPTYSPELNPCELVFGWWKNKIYRGGIPEGENLLSFTVRTFSSLTLQHLTNFYDHCNLLK